MKLKDAFIEAICFGGSIALAIFLGYGLFSFDWIVALKLGISIGVCFFFVMFCSNILTGVERSSKGKVNENDDGDWRN